MVASNSTGPEIMSGAVFSRLLFVSEAFQGSASLELVAAISLQSCSFVLVSVTIVFRSDVAALANSAMAARASALSGIESSCMRLA